jgi:hypothetical protein
VHLSLALFAIELLKIKIKIKVSALQHIKHNQPIKLNAFDSL